MKIELACQINLLRFECIEVAKKYALARGVDRSFFNDQNDIAQSYSPAVFGFKNSSDLTSLVVYYPLSYEIGLWVKKEHRGKREGLSIFAAVIDKLANIEKIYRLYARVDKISNPNTNAMRTILARTGFKKLALSSGHTPQEAWLKEI